ncbi:UDP-glucose 4-epimerase GalE [Methyloceanibacter sp.]|uniref:UDP-glucose 4-epimerase GalE n=1 Tax=Methyloceanibacter sp. TaxID=1965321 RepID=UPI00356775CB
MSVLVTGGAGYIGSHMVLQLLDAGEEVFVLDNLSTGFRWAVPNSAQFLEGDVGDLDLVNGLFKEHKIESVVHFAGSIVVPESVADPLGYYLNNTCKTRNLLSCVVKAKIPNFVFSSTAAVYGIPKINPVGEDTELQPISPYGNSKLMTETMLSDTAKAHPLHFVALRYFNVAGADPKGRSGQSSACATHLIKVASEAALGLRPRLEVFGTDYETPDGTCVRDYIHVTDLVRAHVDALRYLRDGGESVVLNCGYGEGYSVLDVIEAVKRASQSDFPVHLTERREGDPPELVAGAGRIREVLGWEPQLNDLDRIVGDALSWEKRLKQVRVAQ